MKLLNTLKHVCGMLVAAAAAYSPDETIKAVCTAAFAAYLILATPVFLFVAASVPALDGICNRPGYWFAANTIANRSLSADASLGASGMMMLVTDHYALAGGALFLVSLTAIIRMGVNSYYTYEEAAPVSAQDAMHSAAQA